MGAVLKQEHHTIAFISRALGPKWQTLFVYEKELVVVIFAIQKWKQYLIHQSFVIKTDKKSLKWLLENKIKIIPDSSLQQPTLQLQQGVSTPHYHWSQQ